MKDGWTLIETLVSCVIGLMVVLVSYTLFQTAGVEYLKSSTDRQERAEVQMLDEVMRQDWGTRCLELPLWFCSGGQQYSIMPHAVSKSTAPVGERDEQVGWFIRLWPSEALHYGGLEVAYVHYALSQEGQWQRTFVDPLTVARCMEEPDLLSALRALLPQSVLSLVYPRVTQVSMRCWLRDEDGGVTPLDKGRLHPEALLSDFVIELHRETRSHLVQLEGRRR